MKGTIVSSTTAEVDLARNPTLNIQKIRDDFPILRESIRGKPLVYLDSAATSQKPLQVIEAMDHFYRTCNANVHRGLHLLAERATDVYEKARTRVSSWIHAKRPEEIIWTKNATEALNLVAHAYGRPTLKAGDEILITRMEHHANIVPWHQLAKSKGVKVRAVELNPDGTLRLEQFDEILAEGRVKLVAVTHISNVLGTINPIAQIAAKAHAAGALIVVDGCQAVPHLDVNVVDLGADFYAFSAHKMLGPTGLGVLYGRYELLEKMDPFLGGGEMIDEVTLEGATYKPPPLRFEAGTPPIAETAGMLAAVDYLEEIGMHRIREHEIELTRYTLEALTKVEGLRLHGPTDPEQRAGVFSFDFHEIHAHDVAQVLDGEGIAVRAGHHCAQPLMEWLQAPSTSRASVYLYNTKAEIDALVQGLEKVRKLFL